MLQLASLRQAIAPAATAPDAAPPAPPSAADRLRADLDAVKPAACRNAERLLRLAREERAAAADAEMAAIRAAEESERRFGATTRSRAEVEAGRALAAADAEVGKLVARLTAAREDAKPKFREAGREHLVAAGDRLAAALDEIEDVAEVVAAYVKAGTANGFAHVLDYRRIPDVRHLRGLAADLKKGRV